MSSSQTTFRIACANNQHTSYERAKAVKKSGASYKTSLVVIDGYQNPVFIIL